MLFSREGAKISISDLDRARGKETTNLITRRRSFFVKADVSKAEDARKMVDETIRKYNVLDIL